MATDREVRWAGDCHHESECECDVTLPTKPNRVVLQEFISKLTLLKDEAGRVGLFETMQELDKAVKKVGYEVADKLNKAKGKKRGKG